jgi:hypothetical protein
MLRSRCILVWLIPAVFAVVPALASQEGPPTPPAFVPLWNAVPYSPYPLVQNGDHNPVLTAADVTDEQAVFVADPFLFHEGDTWYLFFEALTTRGKIGMATSPDGWHWTYQRIVFQETYHISYPYVFEIDGSYYMIPETTIAQSVRLYRASAFPYNWSYVTTLVSGRDFSDPVVIFYNQTWYLFVCEGPSSTLDLFYADALTGPWTEHPMSPVVPYDRGKARPAGRFVQWGGSHLIRLAQKDNVVYGEGVRDFAVDVLTRSEYYEHELPESPILMASGSGWNATGMHQCDPWWTGTQWIAAVDGASSAGWAIGIYESGPTVSVGEPAFDTAGARLTIGPVTPNPFTLETHIPFEMSAGDPRQTRIAIYGASGRLVRILTAPSPRGTAVWNGCDDAGRPVPSGTYFCAPAGAEGAASKVVLVRP